MIRTIGASALAITAMLSLNGIASAGDDSPGKSSFGTTMTLGGHGTAAQAAAADDTELTGGYHGGGYHGGGYHGGGYHGGGYHGGGYYGGYRGGYGGYYGGYRGGYYGGYRGGYYGGYRPYYAGYGYRPYYGGYGFGLGIGYGYGLGYGYRPYYSSYYPVYSYGYNTGYVCGTSYYGISGTTADANAPVVTLNNATPSGVVPAGGFRYDGDPGKVPLPMVPPQQTQPTPQGNGLPIALTKTPSPYTFKAYGEK